MRYYRIRIRAPYQEPVCLAERNVYRAAREREQLQNLPIWESGKNPAWRIWSLERTPSEVLVLLQHLAKDDQEEHVHVTWDFVPCAGVLRFCLA
ncbi:hypothetical protein J6590_020706 [Homalodisca vitripennis]|nr:hypothetical protein J6590_020706 [Homalodisca vitripennis]